MSQIDPGTPPAPEAAGEKKVPSARLQLVQIAEQLQTLLSKIDVPKRKDSWDKLAILSSFVSSVLLVGVGLVFTHYYDARERDKQAAAQAADRRVAELEAITKLVPQLGSDNEAVRDAARYAVQSIDQTSSTSGSEIRDSGSLLHQFAKIALANDAPDPLRTEATQAIAALAAAPTSSPTVREQALSAITEVANASSSPPAAREIAVDALRDLKTVPREQIRRMVLQEPVSRQIDEVVLHHTWRPAAKDYRGAPTMLAMGRFEISQLGWSHVSWHYAIAPNGDIWIGRPLNDVAPHTPGHDKTNVNVTLILDGDKELPSAAQVLSTAAVLRALFERFELSPDSNFAPGRGFHSDYSEKSCPGKLVTKEDVKSWLSAAD